MLIDHNAEHQIRIAKDYLKNNNSTEEEQAVNFYVDHLNGYIEEQRKELSELQGAIKTIMKYSGNQNVIYR